MVLDFCSKDVPIIARYTDTFIIGDDEWIAEVEAADCVSNTQVEALESVMIVQ